MAVQIILKNSSAEDKRPTPAQLANGEIALNYNAAGAFLTCEDTDGNIQQVGGVKISEIAPDSPVKQTLWFQPSSLTLFVYDGNSFLPIAGGGDGGGGTPGGGITTIIGNNGIDAVTNMGVVTLDVELAGGDDGLEFSATKLKASVASASQLGSVKIGDAISVTGGGTITPRIASASQTGIVKIGDGIDVAGDGTISVEIPQALTFKGSVDLNNPPTGQVELPSAPGDAYVNSATANPVDNGWVGIGGEVAQAGDLVVWDGSQWEIIGTGGTPDVDLGYTAAADQGTVTNTAGNDAVIPIADDTNAGLFTAAEKTKLEGIEDGANVGMTAVNLNYEPNGDSDGTVENDAGNDATIPVAIASDSNATPATAGVAGLFTGEEKEKLAGIQAGATNEGTNDGRYLRTDAAAGDQTVASTGTTTFDGTTIHGGGVKVTGGRVSIGPDEADSRTHVLISGPFATAGGNESALRISPEFVRSDSGDKNGGNSGIFVLPQQTTVDAVWNKGVAVAGTSPDTGITVDNYAAFFADNTVQGGGTNSYGFYSNIDNSNLKNFNFYSSGTAQNFFQGDTYIGGSTTRNTRELWESLLTEEQKEELAAGTLVVPANVATPGDGEFARQWWYDQQSAEDQALIDAGELDYPEHLQATNFTDTFALGDNTKINLLSTGLGEFSGGVKVTGGSAASVNTGLGSSFTGILNFNANGQEVARVAGDRWVIGSADPAEKSYIAAYMPFRISQAGGSTFALGASVSPVMDGDIDGSANVLLFNTYGQTDGRSVASFTHFSANEATGSAVIGGEQAGFKAASSITSAAKNYGFLSSIAANGDKNYGFYAAGTAPNYFNGEVRGGGVDGANNNWVIRPDGSTSPFNIELQMQSDEPTAFQTTYSTDEEGNQVENTSYIGESESLLAIIKDLRARVEALEAAATS